MARYGLTGIGDVEVDKTELIETLRQNRDKHHAVFLRACDLFQAEAIRRLELLMASIRSGKLPRSVSVPLPVPEEHTDDYDRVIGMLKRHIPETIEISEQAYAQLVDDNWGWSDAFLSNTSSYLASVNEDALVRV